MLKTVSIKQLRLGMFIQELKGAWIDHPFWKKAFKLEDLSDLKKLQASVIKEVVIDTSKGLDVAESNEVAEPLLTKAIETPPEITLISISSSESNKVSIS